MDDEGKLSNEQVALIVKAWGLAYAVRELLSADRIADEDLAALWAAAVGLLEKIEAKLERRVDGSD